MSSVWMVLALRRDRFGWNVAHNRIPLLAAWNPYVIAEMDADHVEASAGVEGERNKATLVVRMCFIGTND
jgi:hypothetical protein